jgi:LytS/YehU family sensor histidine kinase
MPVMLEGTLLIHNWYDRRLPINIRLFVSDYRIVRRIIIQILTGMVFYASLAAIALWLYKDVLPATLKFPMLTKPFIVAALFANMLAVIAVNLGLLGKDFFDNWKTELLRNERLSKERAEAQFESLKNQLNPHFLFNALTSLNSLITENPPLAGEFVQQLSKVYRYVLQSRDKEFVSLETEVKFVEHYLRLLKTRFETALQVEIHVGAEARERLIVPVTLQTLVENALKHNIVNAQKPLHITISTKQHENVWYLVVENTLQRRTLVETSNKQGLTRLAALYKHLSPEALKVCETEQTFAVELPLL